MPKRQLTDTFKRSVVLARLSGQGIQEVCERFKVYPPQVNAWLNVYGALPEFEKQRKVFELSHKRAKHSKVAVLPSPKNALLTFTTFSPEVKETFHTLLRRWGVLQLHFNKEAACVRVFSEFVRFPVEVRGEVAEVTSFV